jgi:hypothetical protein
MQIRENIVKKLLNSVSAERSPTAADAQVGTA